LLLIFYEKFPPSNCSTLKSFFFFCNAVTMKPSMDGKNKIFYATNTLSELTKI
jgi:hypothetical protein